MSVTDKLAEERRRRVNEDEKEETVRRDTGESRRRAGATVDIFTPLKKVIGRRWWLFPQRKRTATVRLFPLPPTEQH